MPRLSVLFIRASFVYLLAGFFIGALILAQKGFSYHPPVWNLFPAHVEFLLIGWLAQFAMGVAFWIFPRFSKGEPRGNATLIWVSFASLNAGLLLGVFQFWIPPALLLERALEVAAGIAFAFSLWRRVKPHGV